MEGLVDATLGKPFLATPLRLTLFGFLADARLFVEATSLEFPKKTFASQLFFRDLQGFFNVVVENLNFHERSFDFRARWRCFLYYQERGSLAHASQFHKPLS